MAGSKKKRRDRVVTTGKDDTFESHETHYENTQELREEGVQIYNTYKKGFEADGYLIRDVALFADLNRDNYAKSFYLNKHKRFSFSFYAFCLTFIWFAARKMYAVAAVLFTTLMVLSHVLSYLSAFLLVSIFSGLYAKKIYTWHISRELDRLGARYRKDVPNPELDAQIQDAGGISIPGIIVSALCFAGWLLMIVYVFKPVDLSI